MVRRSYQYTGDSASVIHQVQEWKCSRKCKDAIFRGCYLSLERHPMARMQPEGINGVTKIGCLAPPLGTRNELWGSLSKISQLTNSARSFEYHSRPAVLARPARHSLWRCGRCRTFSLDQCTFKRSTTTKSNFPNQNTNCELQ